MRLSKQKKEQFVTVNVNFVIVLLCIVQFYEKINSLLNIIKNKTRFIL